MAVDESQLITHTVSACSFKRAVRVESCDRRASRFNSAFEQYVAIPIRSMAVLFCAVRHSEVLRGLERVNSFGPHRRAATLAFRRRFSFLQWWMHQRLHTF